MANKIRVKKIQFPLEQNPEKSYIRAISSNLIALASAYEIRYFEDYIISKKGSLENYYDTLHQDPMYSELLDVIAALKNITFKRKS